MSSNVTRRSFFKGAGLAALGGLSAAALSGCGHGYAAAEPTNPSTGDFGGPSWLGAPPVIDEADITETIDTEVLVVGMGTGGIPAMISAAENGAKVLGIDRQGTPHNVREDIGAIDVLERYERWRRFDSTTLALGMDSVNRLFSNDNPLLRLGRWKHMHQEQPPDG